MRTRTYIEPAVAIGVGTSRTLSYDVGCSRCGWRWRAWGSAAADAMTQRHRCKTWPRTRRVVRWAALTLALIAAWAHERVER